ncbi:hypothetical protein AVEN_45760-1 [Araneus ventricosus]|uniref:Uncharacterized protein n=1 Tax=Araneus ventricosus TaxID=182803 RepID=A0A4Y2KNR1_ARAVE|nr:hypothetical protein AVEN_45760-1 [Araneus ventricosus]
MLGWSKGYGSGTEVAVSKSWQIFENPKNRQTCYTLTILLSIRSTLSFWTLSKLFVFHFQDRENAAIMRLSSSMAEHSTTAREALDNTSRPC